MSFLLHSVTLLLLVRLLIVRDFLVLYEILAPIREYEKDFQKTIKIRDFRFLPNKKLFLRKSPLATLAHHNRRTKFETLMR